MSASGKQQEVITSGRKSFAFGLVWQTPDDDISLQKAARSLIRETAGVHDLVVYRRGRPPQFALGSRSAGLKPGTYSAAGVVANTLESSWLVAMRVPTGIWICTGRDGAVLPDGDLIFSNEPEAKEVFRSLLEQTGWSSIYAPVDWGYQLDEIAFEELVRTSPPKWTRLRPTSNAAAILKGSAALIIIGGGIYLGVGILSKQPEQQVNPQALDEILRANAAAAEAERREILARLDSNKPWITLPPADTLVANCVDAIRALPAAPIGFDIESIGCTNGVTEASLRRQAGGFANWLEEWATDYPQVSIEIDNDGESAFMRMDFDRLSGAGDTALPEFSSVGSSLRRRAQIEDVDVVLSSPRVAEIPEHPDYVPLFGSASFSVITRHPDIWVKSFSEYPALRIGNVLFNPADATYRLEGTLYVRNR